MLKNKLDYKLLNSAIIMTIIFLLYKTGNLWIGLITKLASVSFPFLLAFVIAYALYPLLNWLRKKGVPKTLAIILILVLIFSVITSLGIIVFPLLFEQLTSLFNLIITFIKEFSFDSSVDLSSVQDTLSTNFNDIVVKLGQYVSNGALSIIGVSLGYLSSALISFSAAMYFLADMDRIRAGLKKYLLKKSKKIYRYVNLLDKEMHSYLIGFFRIALISAVEYSVIYTIIGHPNAILLGCLAMIAGLIPYFGGICNNLLAAITAFVISPNLFIKTVIVSVVLSGVDGYVINPLVYGKTNKVHPLIVIMSVFVGGALFGIVGIIISLPLAIMIITTYRFFKEDLKEKIEEYKEDIRDENNKAS